MLNNLGNHFYLKIINHNNICQLLVSVDNSTWTVLGENIDVKEMNHNKYYGFQSLRIGLFSAGKGKAQFTGFRYKGTVQTD